jgi:8-oxo-dGTP pyrophosphatase MutT (NUDIX family)
MSSRADRSSLQSSKVVFGQFLAEDFVQGGGVAIFHLASERVVICSAEDRLRRTYYFLPKGRRDAGEDAARGAEREGYEEV